MVSLVLLRDDPILGWCLVGSDGGVSLRRDHTQEGTCCMTHLGRVHVEAASGKQNEEDRGLERKSVGACMPQRVS